MSREKGKNDQYFDKNLILKHAKIPEIHKPLVIKTWTGVHYCHLNNWNRFKNIDSNVKFYFGDIGKKN